LSVVPDVTDVVYWRSEFGLRMHYAIQLYCLSFSGVAFCGIVVTLPNKRQLAQSNYSMCSFLIVHP